MIVVIKNIAGIDFNLRHETTNEIVKTISLKGGCFLNEIDDKDYKELIKQYPSFEKSVEEGFIVVSKSKDIKNQVNIDDTLQDIKNKQDKSKEKNLKSNNVEIKEGI